MGRWSKRPCNAGQSSLTICSVAASFVSKMAVRHFQTFQIAPALFGMSRKINRRAIIEEASTSRRWFKPCQIECWRLVPLHTGMNWKTWSGIKTVGLPPPLSPTFLPTPFPLLTPSATHETYWGSSCGLKLQSPPFHFIFLKSSNQTVLVINVLAHTINLSFPNELADWIYSCKQSGDWDPGSSAETLGKATCLNLSKQMKTQSLLRFTTEHHLNTSSELKKNKSFICNGKIQKTHKMTVRRKQSNFPLSRYMNCIAPNLKQAQSYTWMVPDSVWKKVFGFRLSLQCLHMHKYTSMYEYTINLLTTICHLALPGGLPGTVLRAFPMPHEGWPCCRVWNICCSLQCVLWHTACSLTTTCLNWW